MPLSIAKPACSARRGARLHADAHDDEVAVDRLPVAGAHALHRVSPSNASTPVPEQHPHPVIGVDVAVDGADLAYRGRVPAARQSGSITVTSRPSWRAEAATSEPIQPAPTTTTEPLCAKPFAQGVRVIDAAEVEHAVQIGSGYREPARLGAGGEQQAVVAQPLAVVELELAACGVEGGGGMAEPQLDLLLGVEALLVDVQLLAPRLAAQVVLRQRRSLVGPLVLDADEHHPPLEALLAERRGGLGAGEAGADDHVGLVTGHGNSSS